MPANQSKGAKRVAKEIAFATCPAQVVALGSPTTGTWGLNWHGLGISGLSKTITAAALKTQLQTLAGLKASAASNEDAWDVSCSGLLVTGANGGPYTITAPGWQGQLPFTPGTTAGGWDGTLAVSGGAVWETLKIEKLDPPEDDPGIESKGEMRNAPDKDFDDSVTQGGAKATDSFEVGLRADQFGHLLAMNGYTDVVTGAGPYTHTFTPAVASTNRVTYAVQVYDGLGVYCMAGVSGHDLEVKFGGGEKGDSDSASAKAWGCPTKFVTDALTFTMPDPTTFVRMSPTNAGAAYTVNGTTFKTLSGTIKSIWDSNPLWAGRGTKAPDQPEYKFRHVEHDLTFVFNDATERDAAMTATSATRAAVLTCTGKEALGGGVFDSITFNLPRVRWLKPKNTAGEGAPKATLTGRAMFDQALGASHTVVVMNSRAASYTS